MIARLAVNVSASSTRLSLLTATVTVCAVVLPAAKLTVSVLLS